jgi:hypothetical protein
MNIMNPPENNDPLDKLLQEQNHYIEDAGFTARVMSSLPRPPRRFWMRPLLLSMVTLAGLILSIFWLPWNDLPSLDRPLRALLDAKVLSPWLVVFIVLASLVWGLVAAGQLED